MRFIETSRLQSLHLFTRIPSTPLETAATYPNSPAHLKEGIGRNVDTYVEQFANSFNLGIRYLGRFSMECDPLKDAWNSRYPLMNLAPFFDTKKDVAWK